MSEDQLEQETLGWLADVGYSVRHGPDLAPDGDTPERIDYRRVEPVVGSALSPPRLGIVGQIP